MTHPVKIVQILNMPFTNSLLALADDGSMWFSVAEPRFPNGIIVDIEFNWRPVKQSGLPKS